MSVLIRHSVVGAAQGLLPSLHVESRDQRRPQGASLPRTLFSCAKNSPAAAKHPGKRSGAKQIVAATWQVPLLTGPDASTPKRLAWCS
jgi:hypothetical protein